MLAFRAKGGIDTWVQRRYITLELTQSSVYENLFLLTSRDGSKAVIHVQYGRRAYFGNIASSQMKLIQWKKQTSELLLFSLCSSV